MICFEGRETFRIYVDLPANSGVHASNINLRFDPGVTDICRSKPGNIDWWGWSFLYDDGLAEYYIITIKQYLILDNLKCKFIIIYLLKILE